MKIVYTSHSIEGEPGPNIYWRGTPDEFLKLLVDLRPLACGSGFSIDIQDLKYIHYEAIESYKLTSLKDAKTLSRVENGHILSELDSKVWEGFLHKVLSLSFGRGYHYQDQEDISKDPLISDANIIMSSEDG